MLLVVASADLGSSIMFRQVTADRVNGDAAMRTHRGADNGVPEMLVDFSATPTLADRSLKASEHI